MIGQTMRGVRRDTVAFVVLATIVPLCFALYTQHTWEDFFITFRHSVNLCEGHGLVYNVGQRVHGFTSPLGVLLPAFCYWLTGEQSYVPALWLFRLLSIAAFAVGGLLVWKALQRDESHWGWLKFLFPVLYVLEAKSVDYSINGMETGFMLLFLGWAIYLLEADGPRVWLARGLCWAGLMWTRPDGFVYVIALSLAQWAFVPEQRTSFWRKFVPSGLLGALLYLPWFVGAWAYYGSPIPNTVISKAPDLGPHPTIGLIVHRLYDNFPTRAAEVFMPHCSWAWVEYAKLTYFCYGLGIFCAIYWLLPVRDRLGRMASLSFAVVTLYFSHMELLFGWYAPPAALLGLLALSRGVYCLAEALCRRVSLARLMAGGALGGVCMGMACMFFYAAHLMRLQQKYVETGNRVPIGLWLKDHVHRGETVFLEPLGYIGYFSNAHMIDWPGLVAPQVVRARKSGSSFAKTLEMCKPDWAVIRPIEKDFVLKTDPDFKKDYAEVKYFDVGGLIERYRSIHGWIYMNCDARFCVFKKRSAPDDRLSQAGLATP